MLRLRQILLTNTRAAIDLASIMVGILVIGILGGIVAATVFAVIPWAQDRQAKANLDAVRQAQNVYAGFAATGDNTALGKGDNGLAFISPISWLESKINPTETAVKADGKSSFGTYDQLVAKKLIPYSDKVNVASPAGDCFTMTVLSSTGKIFWSDSSKGTTGVLDSNSVSSCTSAPLDTVLPKAYTDSQAANPTTPATTTAPTTSAPATTPPATTAPTATPTPTFNPSDIYYNNLASQTVPSEIKFLKQTSASATAATAPTIVTSASIPNINNNQSAIAYNSWAYVINPITLQLSLPNVQPGTYKVSASLYNSTAASSGPNQWTVSTSVGGSQTTATTKATWKTVGLDSFTVSQAGPVVISFAFSKPDTGTYNYFNADEIRVTQIAQ